MQACLFCGGDPSERDHAVRCDGRQGAIETTLYGDQGDVPYEVTAPTSAAAAATIDGDTLARLEALVLHTLRAKPRTCDAVEEATGLPHQTASARIRGLVLRDRVQDSGQRAATRHGRRAVVWCVTT
jgi:hypothetical protein